MLQVLRKIRPDLAKSTLQEVGLSESDYEKHDWFKNLLEWNRPNKVREIVKRYHTLESLAGHGLSVSEAATESGIPSPTIHKYAKKYGLEFRDARKMGNR